MYSYYIKRTKREEFLNYSIHNDSLYTGPPIRETSSDFRVPTSRKVLSRRPKSKTRKSGYDESKSQTPKSRIAWNMTWR